MMLVELLAAKIFIIDAGKLIDLSGFEVSIAHSLHGALLIFQYVLDFNRFVNICVVPSCKCCHIVGTPCNVSEVT